MYDKSILILLNIKARNLELPIEERMKLSELELASVVTGWSGATSLDQVEEYFAFLRRHPEIYKQAIENTEIVLAGIFLPSHDIHGAKPLMMEIARDFYNGLYSEQSRLREPDVLKLIDEEILTISQVMLVISRARGEDAHPVVKAYAEEASKLTDEEYGDPKEHLKISQSLRKRFESWEPKMEAVSQPKSKTPRNPFRPA